MDLFDKCQRYTAVQDAIAQGCYPYFLPFSDAEGTEVVYQGRRLIMAGSNNYLGLTADLRVQQAAIEAVEQYGSSCTGSRFLNGTLELHTRLERELADFLGKEAALVFATGFQANLGVVSTLVGRHDVVLLDRDDHASLVEGCRLSYGKLQRFRHNDMADLERLLQKCPDDAGKLVVVDGVYSMGGDIAPLPHLVALCRAYGARLLVDDAHAIGVLGEGRGTGAHFGLSNQIDLISGTFSKSFASLGGFVAGDAPVISYIKHTARSFIFSASLPPASTAAALAALRIMRDEPEHAHRVVAIGSFMRDALRDMGYETGATETPIVPILTGDTYQTCALWQALFDGGVFVNSVIPPAVPSGSGRLRTSYMATHTDEQVERMVAVFAASAHQQRKRSVGV